MPPALYGRCVAAEVTQTAVVPAVGSQAVKFPLSVDRSNRFLEDAAGRPFLIHGDAAWSLIAGLTRVKTELYLKDRQARGFNTLLVSLIEHRFSSNPPANAYGQRPFATQSNFAMPNEAYFAHADWVIRKAGELGFLVLLAPAYAGFEGGEQGWYREMVASGADKLREYGRYLGKRYRDFENVLWVNAVDYNPPDKDLIRAIAEGISEFEPHALQTAQGAPESAALDYWAGERWLRVNSIYTYRPVHAAALAQRRRVERMPFFLIESAYENEHGTTEQRLRAQAYHALLSGAAGQIFGNNPIWHFDGPGLYPVRFGWEQALASRGAQSMTYLRKLFEGLPWWMLEPDDGGSGRGLVVSGVGAGEDQAVAAVAADRSLAIVYLPTARSIEIDLGHLSGPRFTARWYDPATGRFLELMPGPSAVALGRETFCPPGGNGGFGDWVLLLRSQP